MLADLGDDIAFAQARLGGGRIGLNFLDDQAALIVLLDRGAEIARVAGGARRRDRRRDRFVDGAKLVCGVSEGDGRDNKTRDDGESVCHWKSLWWVPKTPPTLQSQSRKFL